LVQLEADGKLLELRGLASGRRVEAHRKRRGEAEAELSELQGREEALVREMQELGVSFAAAHLSANPASTDLPESPSSVAANRSNISEAVRASGLLVSCSFERDFEIVGLLGGDHHRSPVYHVKELKDGRQCVVKELMLGSRSLVRQLEAEVEARRRLHGKPGIAPLEAVFFSQGAFKAYLQMPFYQGGTLREWIQANKPQPWHLQGILRSVTESLAALHDCGLVHRDLKLDNILMGPAGAPFLTDFEFVKLADVERGNPTDLLAASTTMAGAFKGTFGYAAPEVIAGQPHTPASDMYALGVMCFAAHFDSLPPPPQHGVVPVPATRKGQKLPPRLKEALQSLLAHDPSARPSAHELLRMPIFTGSYVDDLGAEGLILRQQQRVGVARLMLQQMRRIVSSRDARRSEQFGFGDIGGFNSEDEDDFGDIGGFNSDDDDEDDEFEEDDEDDEEDDDGEDEDVAEDSEHRQRHQPTPSPPPHRPMQSFNPHVGVGHVPFGEDDRASDVPQPQQQEEEQQQRRRGGGLSMHVSRLRIVRDVSNAFMAISPDQLLREQLNVTFQGEFGIDAGGLRTDMFTEFFIALTRNRGEEDPEEGDPAERGEPTAFDDKGLPRPNANLRFVQAAGRILARAIFDGVPVPQVLSPILFRFLLKCPLRLQDLEDHNGQEESMLRFLLINRPDAAPNGGPGPWSAWGLTFDNGDDVTEENKEKYISEYVRAQILRDRLPALRAFVAGFSDAGLHEMLSLLGPSDLMLLAHGATTLTPELVWASVSVPTTDWGDSPTPEILKALIFALDADRLSRFLRLSTSAVSIPVGTLLQPKITLRRAAPEGMIFAHTCSRELEVPDCRDANTLGRMLALALDHVDAGGFGAA